MIFLYIFTEIRRPEELSLARPLEESHLKFNYGEYSAASTTVTSGPEAAAEHKKTRRRITLPSMTSSNGHGAHHNGNGANGGSRAVSTHSLLLEPTHTPTR